MAVHIENALGDGPRLPFVGGIVVLAGGTGNNQQFGFAAGRLRIRGGRHQLLPLVVIDPAGFPRHQLAEHKIHGFGDLWTAAEIVVQRNRSTGSLTVIGGIGIPAPDEQFRHRLPEAVDTLLDIADEKKVLLVAGNGAEKRILRGVGILVFVHQDFFKPVGQLCGERGALPFAVSGRLEKQTERPVLQIVEIHHTALLFLGLKLLAEQPYGGKQLRGIPAGKSNVVPALGGSEAQKIRQLADHFRRLFA